MPRLFTIRDGAARLEQALTPLQRAQLDAALNLHALLHPGRALRVEVSSGDISQMPVFSGPASERAESAGTRIATLEIVSEARPPFVEGGGSGAADADAAPAAHASDPVANAEAARSAVLVRYVRLAHADATPATTRPPQPLSFARRVYGELERRTPTVLDAVRETIMRRRERSIASPLPRYPEAVGDAEVAEAFARIGSAALHEPAPDAPPAALFGLHWLQTGGAERWAVESIGIAKQQGLLPVVVVDQNSVHPWLLRPEIEGCIVIALSSETREPEIEPELAAALLANFALRGIMLHHCYWLYRALPWIKQRRPELPVVDSLHIVEYLGGGYPGLAVRFDEHIDRHHAISPELVRWLEAVQGVAPGKTAMAPLAALTAPESRGFKPREAGSPFTLSFIGRLSRQKRPDLFILLAHRLRRRGVDVRIVMHGDGEMREVVDGLITQYGLADVIEQRFEDVPVADTLADSDLLVITSINEGLTLTTFEALAAGVPVLSTDVGSQRTIVQDEMLLPRPAQPFLRRAVRVISSLAGDEWERERVWALQHERMVDFAGIPDAHHFTKELFAQWQQ